MILCSPSPGVSCPLRGVTYCKSVLLSTNVRTPEYDPALPPQPVAGDFVRHEVLELLLEPDHEGSPRGDAVGVKPLLLGQLLPLVLGLLLVQLGLLSRSESSSSLLVHLSSGSNPINCHEEHLNIKKVI